MFEVVWLKRIFLIYCCLFLGWKLMNYFDEILSEQQQSNYVTKHRCLSTCNLLSKEGIKRGWKHSRIFCPNPINIFCNLTSVLTYLLESNLRAHTVRQISYSTEFRLASRVVHSIGEVCSTQPMYTKVSSWSYVFVWEFRTLKGRQTAWKRALKNNYAMYVSAQKLAEALWWKLQNLIQTLHTLFLISCKKTTF